MAAAEVRPGAGSNPLMVVDDSGYPAPRPGITVYPPGGGFTSQGGPEATSLRFSGGQGVHREVESEGHEEKYRAVIDGGYPDEEPIGPRWGEVEPAL